MKPQMTNRLALLACLLVLNVTAIGATTLNPVTPYLPIALTVTAVIAIAFNRLPENWHGIALFTIALSFLWSTSLLGQLPVGVDIHQEVFLANYNYRNGFDINYSNGANTSLAVAIISPALQKLGIPIALQFKALFPTLFAFVAPMLYGIYARLIGKRQAFLATVFIIIMPMFVMDMTSHVKGLASQFGLVLALYSLFNIKSAWKYAGIVGGIIWAIVNHYSVAPVVIGYFGALALFTPLAAWIYRTPSLVNKKALIGFALLAVVVMVGWYANVGNGSILKTFLGVGKNISTITQATIDSPKEQSETQATVIDPPKEQSEAESKIAKLQEKYDVRTVPVEKNKGYLYKQEQLVRTALGLDWPDASGLGKLFRALQYLTQAFLLIGGLTIIFRRSLKFPAEYRALLFGAMAMISGCLFIPYLSTVMSTSRFYQLSLYLAAPLMIVGGQTVFRRHAVKAVSALLAVYLLFTTGSVFELGKQMTLDRIDVPYSYVLSWQRMGVIGVYTPNDIKARDWFVENRDKEIWVEGSLLGRDLIWEIDMVIGVLPRDTDKLPRYLFVTEWEWEHQKLVYARPPGLRFYRPLDNLADARLVYRIGEARIYRYE